ncbi:hypothetical protein M758_8G023800, partial [Ceratodon purpureus]
KSFRLWFRSLLRFSSLPGAQRRFQLRLGAVVAIDLGLVVCERLGTHLLEAYNIKRDGSCGNDSRHWQHQLPRIHLHLSETGLSGFDLNKLPLHTSTGDIPQRASGTTRSRNSRRRSYSIRTRNGAWILNRKLVPRRGENLSLKLAPALDKAAPSSTSCDYLQLPHASSAVLSA